MKTTTLKTLSAVTLVAGCLMGSQASQASIIIDDFNSFQVAVDANPTAGSIDSATLADVNVLGGYREFIANRTNPTTGTLQVRTSSNEFGTNTFIFDQTSSTTRGMGSIIYDGDPTQVLGESALNTTGLAPGVDLTAGGTLTFFTFKDLAVTGNGLVLTVSLYNSLGVASTATVNLVDTNGTSIDLLIPYATFSNPGTPSAVYAVKIDIDGRSTGARGSDLTFDLVSSEVPEPASLGLLGVGGLLALRRRRD